MSVRKESIFPRTNKGGEVPLQLVFFRLAFQNNRVDGVSLEYGNRLDTHWGPLGICLQSFTSSFFLSRDPVLGSGIVLFF